MAGLDSIPPELISLIAGHLYIWDFRELRLTARKIRDNTEGIFAKRFLHKISVKLTEESVLSLQTISQHHAFRHFVKRVDLLCPPVNFGGPNILVYLEKNAESVWFAKTGKLVGDALKRFPQCTTLSVMDTGGQRKFKPNEAETAHTRNSALVKHMWLAALEALGEVYSGGERRITSLFVGLGRHNGAGILTRSLAVPEDSDESVLCALKDVKSFSLFVENQLVSGQPAGPAATSMLMNMPGLEKLSVGGREGVEFLRGYLSRMEDLSKRKYDGELGDGVVNAESAVLPDKLDAAVVTATTERNLYSGGLVELEIVDVQCRYAELAQVLVRYGTTLDKIVLCRGMLKCNENQWPALMRELRQGLPRCRLELSGLLNYRVDGEYIPWELNVGHLGMSTDEEFAKGVEKLEHFVQDEEAFWLDYAESGDT